MRSDKNKCLPKLSSAWFKNGYYIRIKRAIEVSEISEKVQEMVAALYYKRMSK